MSTTSPVQLCTLGVAAAFSLLASWAMTRPATMAAAVRAMIASARFMMAPSPFECALPIELPSRSAQLEMLEIERPEQTTALPAEQLGSAPQALRRHVDHRQSQILGGGRARRGGQRVSFTGQII